MSEEMFTFEEEGEKNVSRLNIEAEDKKKADKTEAYVRQTFLITPQMKKALKIKAISEGQGLNEMLREILNKSVEKKYFKKI